MDFAKNQLMLIIDDSIENEIRSAITSILDEENYNFINYCRMLINTYIGQENFFWILIAICNKNEYFEKNSKIVTLPISHLILMSIIVTEIVIIVTLVMGIVEAVTVEDVIEGINSLNCTQPFLVKNQSNILSGRTKLRSFSSTNGPSPASVRSV